MPIHPIVVASARIGWQWQWRQLMNGLAPADSSGNYIRPKSQHQNAILPKESDLIERSLHQKPLLIIGRSCPWAHRTWLIYEIRNLQTSLQLLIAQSDHKGGQWRIEPSWRGCDSLLSIYKKCGSPPNHRATVPTLIDPGINTETNPKILGNESAQLVELLNQWPTIGQEIDLSPAECKEEIHTWQKLLQPSVNDGVYRCGFARTQSAYNKACNELFSALKIVEESLSKKGPWLCGEKLSLADLRLFPTLIRWEMVYMPLFGCSTKPLWAFPKLWNWRQAFFNLTNVEKTCDYNAWRNDYFGALFPLRPSGIIPDGPELSTIINSTAPKLK